MGEWIVEQWAFPFIRNAVIGLFFLALAVAPLSIFIVQQRMAFAAEAMPHATLPGIILGTNVLLALGIGLSTFWLTLAAFAGLLLIVWLATALSWRSIFRNEAVLAGVFVFAFAFGVLLLSILPSPLNLQEFIRGSILGLTTEKTFGFAVLAALSGLVMAFLHRPLILQTQDPEFFGSVYRSGWWVSQTFMSLFTLVLIATLIVFGTLMAVSAAIFPGLIARCWFNSLPRIMAVSFLALVMASWGALAVSLLADNLPLAPLVVMALFGLWLLSAFLGPYGLRLSLTSSSNRD